MLHNLDCRIGMQGLKDGEADHFYADPPFGINFSTKESMYNREKGKVRQGYTESEGDYYTWCMSWLVDLNRVVHGSGVICSGWTHLGPLLIAVEKAGFKVQNHIIWHYPFGPATKKKFVSSHQHILWVHNNHEPWFNRADYKYLDCQDVWYIKREYKKGKQVNANEQPSALMRKITKYMFEPESYVIDLFAGSGKLGRIVENQKCRYTGWEINSERFTKHQVG